MGTIVNISSATATPTLDERLAASTRERAPVRQEGRNKTDTVEISADASRIANIEEVRNERNRRIEEIRHEIADNRYETDRRIEATVEKIFARLNALDVHV